MKRYEIRISKSPYREISGYSAENYSLGKQTGFRMKVNASEPKVHLSEKPEVLLPIRDIVPLKGLFEPCFYLPICRSKIS